MKYYVALRFRGEPDIHMTLNYYGELDADALAALRDLIDEKVRVNSPQAFALSLTEPVSVGFRSPMIRALRPSVDLPLWILAFVQRRWLPHVVTMQERLDLVVDAIAIMHKKEEIARWELS